MLKCDREDCSRNMNGSCGLFKLCEKYSIGWMQWKNQGCLQCKNLEMFIIPLYIPGLPEDHPGNYKQMYRESNQ